MSESRQRHHQNQQSPTLGDAIAYGVGVEKITPDGERLGISVSDFFRVGVDTGNEVKEPTNEQRHLKNCSTVQLSAVPFAPAVYCSWTDDDGQLFGNACCGITLADALRKMADWMDAPAAEIAPRAPHD